MKERRLKMNNSKTEIMVIGSSNMIKSTKNEFDQVALFGDSTIMLSEKSRNLGFIFDQTLSLSNQINKAKQKAICGLTSKCIH